MRMLFGLLLLVSTGLYAEGDDAHALTVRVTNIPGVKGNLLVGLYQTAESFTDSPMAESPKIKLVTAEDQIVVFDDLKPGKYAVAVVQDLNRNGKLDRNFLGMPKEPLGFSVIKKIPKGKPKFEDCAFEIRDEPVAMVIALVTK